MNPSQEKKFNSMVKTHSHRTLFFILGLSVVAGIVFFTAYFSQMKNKDSVVNNLNQGTVQNKIITDEDKIKLLEANAVKSTISDAQKIKLLENAEKANKN